MALLSIQLDLNNHTDASKAACILNCVNSQAQPTPANCEEIPTEITITGVGDTGELVGACLNCYSPLRLLKDGVEVGQLHIPAAYNPWTNAQNQHTGADGLPNVNGAPGVYQVSCRNACGVEVFSNEFTIE